MAFSKGKGKGSDSAFQFSKGKGKDSISTFQFSKGFNPTLQFDKGKGKGFDSTLHSSNGKGFNHSFQSNKGKGFDFSQKGKGFDFSQKGKGFESDASETFNLPEADFKILFGSLPIKLQRFIKLRLPKIKKNKNDHFCYDHCIGKRASIFELHKDEIEDHLEIKFWVKNTTDVKSNTITLVDADLKNLMIGLDFIENMNTKLKNSMSIDFDMENRRFDLFKFKELEDFIKTKLDYAGVDIILNFSSDRNNTNLVSASKPYIGNTVKTTNYFDVFYNSDDQEPIVSEKETVRDIIKSINLTGPEDNINKVLSLMKLHFSKKKSKTRRSKESNQNSSDDDITQDSTSENDEYFKEMTPMLVSEYEQIVIESDSEEDITLRELNKGEKAPSTRDICKNKKTGNIKSKVPKNINITLTSDQAYAVVIELPGCHNARVEIISSGHMFEKKSIMGRLRGAMCKRNRDNKLNGLNRIFRSNVVIVAFRDFQTNIVDVVQKIPDDSIKDLITNKMIPKKYYSNPENDYCDDTVFDDGFTWIREDEDFDIDLI